MISLKRVTKSYGPRQVLQIDRLDLKLGECVFVSGGNGSGKSTLLRVLAGITTITSGGVERACIMNAMHAIYLPQHGGFNPDRSVARHLAAVSNLYRGRRFGGNIGNTLAGELGIERLLSMRMGRLSGGFQRLVMLAGAMSVEPDAIFLDEPLNGLDPSFRTIVANRIAKLSGSAALLVITGHSSDEAPENSRQIRIVNGRTEESAC